MNRLSIASFTNLGFRRHARKFEPTTADMSGKTVVVTGATGGLGFEAAQTLAGLGARVLIVGRNEDKLKAASASIGGLIFPMRADLSLMSEVRRLADGIMATAPQIDVLINNVGVLLPERSVSGEGIESTLATNLAGHFLLTNLLIPRIVESAPSRIINVTSGGMYSQRIVPDDLQYERGEYAGATAYARTKRGQVILTEMWAAALAQHGVVVHSMHPGWAKTAGVAFSLPTFNRVMRPFLRSPEQGADTIVWLAAEEEATLSTGGFWFDRNQVPTHLSQKTIETSDDRKRLWDGLVELTGCDLPVTLRL